MTSRIELKPNSLDLIITKSADGQAASKLGIKRKGSKTLKPEVLKLSYPMINGNIDGSFVNFLRESIANGTLTADIAEKIAECKVEDIEVNKDATLKITRDGGVVEIPKVFPANRQQQLVMALNSDYRDAVMAVDLAERLDIFNRTAYNGKPKGEVTAHTVNVEKRGKPSKDLKPSRFVVDIQAVEDNFNENKKETSKKDQKTEKGKIRIAAMLAAVPLGMVHPSKQKDNGDLDVFADQAFDPLVSSVGRSKTFTDNFLGEELLGSSLGRSKTPSALIAKKHKVSKYASPKKQEALTLGMLNEVTKGKIENEAEVAGNFAALFMAAVRSHGLQPRKRADRIFASNLAQARLLLKLANPYKKDEPIATALGNENVDTGLTIEQEIKNQMSNFASAYKSAARGNTVAKKPDLKISVPDLPVHDAPDLKAIGVDAESKLKKKTFTAHKAKSSTLKAPAKDAAKEKTKTGDQTTFFTKKIQLQGKKDTDGKKRKKSEKHLVVSLPSSESIRHSKQIQATHPDKTPTRKLNSFGVVEFNGDTNRQFSQLLQQSKHLVAAKLTAEQSELVAIFKKTNVAKLANATLSASHGFMPGVSKDDELMLAHQIVFLDHKIIQAKRDGNKPLEATSKLALKIALQNEKPIKLDSKCYKYLEQTLLSFTNASHIKDVDSFLDLIDVKFLPDVYSNKEDLTNAIAARITQAYQGLTDQSLDADPYSPTISDDEISHPGHTAIGSLGDGHLSRSESYHNAIGQGGTRASDNPFSAASTHVDQPIRSSTLGPAEQVLSDRSTNLARRNEASGHSISPTNPFSSTSAHSGDARKETSTDQPRKLEQTSTSANPFSSTSAYSDAAREETSTVQSRKPKQTSTSANPFSSTPANSGATTDEQTRLGRRFKEGGTSTHVQKLEEQRRKPRVISANMNL